MRAAGTLCEEVPMTFFRTFADEMAETVFLVVRRSAHAADVIAVYRSYEDAVAHAATDDAFDVEEHVLDEGPFLGRAHGPGWEGVVASEPYWPKQDEDN